MVGHVLHQLAVQGGHGFFEVVDAQFLARVGELYGATGIGERVQFEDDVRVGSDRVSDGFEAGIT